jgi:hypothetical protein
MPISSVAVSGMLVPIGAANYFRQIPCRLIARGVESWTVPSRSVTILPHLGARSHQPDEAVPLLTASGVKPQSDSVPEVPVITWKYEFTSVARHPASPPKR